MQTIKLSNGVEMPLLGYGVSRWPRMNVNGA